MTNSPKNLRLRQKGVDGATLEPYLRERRKIQRCVDLMDPNFRRLRYIRYADDFLLGFAGPRAEAEAIKDRIGMFLRDNLKLELSPEKTLITHAGTENARFLGYEIGVRDRREQTGVVVLLLPAQKLETKISKYRRDGKSVHRPELISSADFTIVQKYGAEYEVSSSIMLMPATDIG